MDNHKKQKESEERAAHRMDDFLHGRPKIENQDRLRNIQNSRQRYSRIQKSDLKMQDEQDGQERSIDET